MKKTLENIRNKVACYNWTWMFFDISLIFIFGIFFFFNKYTKYAVLGMLVGIIPLIIIKKKIYIGLKEIIVLLAFFLLRWIGFSKDVSLIVNTLLPFLLYFYPKMVLKNSKICDAEKYIEKMMFALISGAIAENMLSITAYIKCVTLSDYFVGRRQWPSYYYFIDIPATQYAFFTVLLSGTILKVVYEISKKKYSNIIYLVIIILSEYFQLFIIGQRSSIVILGCLIFILILFMLNEYIKKYRLFFCFAIIILFLCFIFAIRNTGVVNDVWLRDGGILGNIRFKAQTNAISQMVKYPFGGEKMDICGLSAVHNFWLDLYYVAGVLPFVLVMIITIKTLIDVFYIFRNGQISVKLKLYVIGVYISLLLYLSIESVVKGSVVMCSIWLFVSAIVSMMREVWDDEKK